jgi:tetratricopeptide (TPR) repeat protein
MTVMSGRGGDGRLEARVERCLERCGELSQLGRHRRVLAEVEQVLPLTGEKPRLEARLLVWKAQALLTMGCADRALPAASRSWDLEPSPHACHLMSNSLNALGNADESEGLLRMGWELFPNAIHLPVQLAMLLTDQGRLPEALDALNEVTPGADTPDDVQIFLFGLRVNLLATMARWTEARVLLEEGLERHPSSIFLHEAKESLSQAWEQARAEQELEASWSAGLDPLTGVAAEVDDAIIRCGAVMEVSTLEVLAARRLWRGFMAAVSVCPHAPDPWAAALLLAVYELDGERPSAAALARAVDVNPGTVRSALRRLRAFVHDLEPEFARRSYAARCNPRLTQVPSPRKHRPGTIINFPGATGLPEQG